MEAPTNEALTLVSKALAILKVPDDLSWTSYQEAVTLLESAVDKLTLSST